MSSAGTGTAVIMHMVVGACQTLPLLVFVLLVLAAVGAVCLQVRRQSGGGSDRVT